MSMPLSHFVPAYPSPSPYPQVHSLVGRAVWFLNKSSESKEINVYQLFQEDYNNKIFYLDPEVEGRKKKRGDGN